MIRPGGGHPKPHTKTRGNKGKGACPQGKQEARSKERREVAECEVMPAACVADKGLANLLQACAGMCEKPICLLDHLGGGGQQKGAWGQPWPQLTNPKLNGAAAPYRLTWCGPCLSVGGASK